MEDVRKLVKSVQEIDGGKKSYLWFSSNVERADHDYMGFLFIYFLKKATLFLGLTLGLLSKFTFLSLKFP